MRRWRHGLVVALCAAVAVVGATPATAAQPDLEDLRVAVQDLTYPVPVVLGVQGDSRATAVSGTGIVAGTGTRELSPTWQATTLFRWTDGRLEESEVSGVPVAVAASGRVLVALAQGAGYVLWEPDGTLTSLVGSSGASSGWMDDAGTVVGTLFERAYVWQDGQARRLDPARRVTVVGNHSLDAAGEVVGSSQEAGRWRAFRWRDGAVRYLEAPDGAQTRALGVNASGQVLVAHDALGPAVWEPDGELRPLDTAGTGFTPRRIDDRGVVVGTVPAVSSPQGQVPAVADARGVRRLPGLGGNVGDVREVAPNGLAVGVAARTRWGQLLPVAWVAELPVPLGLTPAGGTAARTGEPTDVSSGGRVVGNLVHVLPDGSRRTTAVVWDLVPQR